jgi:hypothetical protein
MYLLYLSNFVRDYAIKKEQLKYKCLKYGITNFIY